MRHAPCVVRARSLRGHGAVLVPDRSRFAARVAAVPPSPRFPLRTTRPGLVLLVFAGFFFYASQDDLTDTLKILHGLSQALAGGSLYFLWQAVPQNMHVHVTVTRLWNGG